MNKQKRKLKALVLSTAMAALMLLAIPTANAQGKPGGLFGGSSQTETCKQGMLRSTGVDINTNGGLLNDDFGEEEPLGSGLVILIGAGLGYVTLKKKEDKQ